MIVNKLRVRRELVRLGRSKLEVLANDDIEALTTWPFPGCRGFVKNVHGAGSYGVRGVSDLAALNRALADINVVTTSRPSLTQTMNASQDRMLEQAATGVLLSFEAVITAGKCVTIGFTRPHLLEAEIGDREPRPMPGCTHPYHFEGEHIVELFIAESLGALGYTDGPVHIEIIVSDNGECEIIDLNPRFAGAHCLWAMNAAHEVPVEKLLADWCIGKVSVDDLPPASNTACLQYFLAPSGIDRFDSLVLPVGPNVTWAAQFKTSGEALAHDRLDSGWVGGFVVQAKTRAEVVSAAKHLRHEVRVNGRMDVGY